MNDYWAYRKNSYYHHLHVAQRLEDIERVDIEREIRERLVDLRGESRRQWSPRSGKRVAR